MGNGIRTIAPDENCPLPVRVRVWFKVSVKIRVGEQFTSGAIVLEPVRNAYEHLDYSNYNCTYKYTSKVILRKS